MKYVQLILLILLISHSTIIQSQAHKKAMIFGVTGQDGSYLAEFLLDKGYEVHGIKRRTSTLNTSRLDYLHNTSERKKILLHDGDLTDFANILRLIKTIAPDEIYNLAAQSHVGISFELPEYTADVDALGPLRILEAIRLAGLAQKTKFYQASSSEMFGKVQAIPQSENTPFYPRSPYGVAKLFAFWITKNYRESYNIFGCNGILFNHESPKRGENFVTRKITRAVSKISLGLQNHLELGNLDAQRDWGHAQDYVEAMWLILQQKQPEDFVIGTGETHSVREFVELSFQEVGITIEWQGKGLSEIGYNQETGQKLVLVNPKYFRPAEVDLLISNPSKAHKALQWKPKRTFAQLVKEMIRCDLAELTQ